MQATTNELNIRVGEEGYPIKLTDSAVEAVQGEAAGRLIAALANVWAIEKEVEAGEGFSSLEIERLIDLRQELGLASEMADVLIECRPLEEIGLDEDPD